MNGLTELESPVDVVGQIETRGVDYIPETERHSNPRELGYVFFGTQLCFGIIVLGYLPISFGLSWWPAVTSTLFGLAIGSAMFAPLALLSTRTGTNSAVSSGAHFGVVGRIVGSLVGIFTAVGFYALTVWTGGEALIAGMHKVFGTPNNNVALGIGYAVIAAVTLVVAVFGHASVVAANRFLIPTMGLLLIVGVFALAPKFSAGPNSAPLLLGSFAPTWLLSAVTAASLPISYSPYVGDYTRYISGRRWSQRKVMAAAGLGMFGGCAIALTFAIYVATTFPADVTDWVAGLVQQSPTWYAVPIVLVALAGSFAQAGLCVYGTGLDTSSIIPALKRVPATLLIGAIGTGVVFVGSFVYDLVSAASAFLIILIVVTAPWLVINVIGYLLSGKKYRPFDLQVFNMTPRVRGGAYWFTAGWNIPAMATWLVATGIGLLFVNCTFYVGPWANAAGGVDLSFVSASVIAAAAYPVLATLVPGSIVRVTDADLADLTSPVSDRSPRVPVLSSERVTGAQQANGDDAAALA